MGRGLSTAQLHVLSVVANATELWGDVGCKYLDRRRYGGRDRRDVFCGDSRCRRCRGKSPYGQAIEDEKARMHLRPAVVLYIGEFYEDYKEMKKDERSSNVAKAAHSRTVRRLIARGLVKRELASRLYSYGWESSRKWARYEDFVLRITNKGMKTYRLMVPVGSRTDGLTDRDKTAIG